MRVHSLICGRFHPLGAWLFHGRGSMLSRGLIVCRCLLVESPQGLILIDTGQGADDYRQWARPWMKPLRWLLGAEVDETLTARGQIRKLGFEPEAVRHIVITHLDVDHVAGLTDFPQAQVHVSSDEHQAMAKRSHWLEKIRYKPAYFAHGPRWVTYAASGQAWMGIENVQPVAGLEDELLLIPLPGHSRGHCGVAIRTGQGWILHTGDALLHHGELESPSRCPLFYRLFGAMVRQDRTRWAQSLQRVRELASDERITLVNAHDPAMDV